MVDFLPDFLNGGFQVGSKLRLQRINILRVKIICEDFNSTTMQRVLSNHLQDVDELMDGEAIQREEELFEVLGWDVELGSFCQHSDHVYHQGLRHCSQFVHDFHDLFDAGVGDGWG